MIRASSYQVVDQVQGDRLAVVLEAFEQRTWAHESDDGLIEELWASTDDRIAGRFAYEWVDLTRACFRSSGDENWAFDAQGLTRERHASIDDVAINVADRDFHWHRTGPRPSDHPGLSEMGL